jgi:hypothetical protein
VRFGVQRQCRSVHGHISLLRRQYQALLASTLPHLRLGITFYLPNRDDGSGTDLHILT